MESKDTTSKVEEQGLRNLQSDYFIQKFFGYMSERKYLETIRYNKSIQKRINININHYKAYSETKTSIELDIIPMKGKIKSIFIYTLMIIKKKKLKIHHYIKMIMFLKYR